MVEEAHSSKLYNMILLCIGDGLALNIIEKAKSNNGNVECGYQAWNSLKTWFVDGTQKNTMIQHYEAKLHDLHLDIDTTATDFINNFKLYVWKLGRLKGVVWSDDKKIIMIQNAASMSKTSNC
eukprot:9751565-Ditylum_brightwellii.AAC.1